MADLSAMSDEGFYAYLKDKGMIEEDVQKLQSNGYNGRSIFHLDAERQFSMELSQASRDILKAMLEHNPVKDEVDTDTTRNDERLLSLSDADHIKFFMLGLGKGVDASEPSPLAGSSCNEAVRIIDPDKCNITEKPLMEKRNYMKCISSFDVHKTSVKASVSDLVGKVLTLEAEAEYKRENEKDIIICGEREITRSLSFMPYCFQDTSCCNKDSNFEKKFCEYLIQEIPEIGSQPVPKIGSELTPSPADKVQHYLVDDSSRFDQVLQKAYKFIKREKVTHYISEIELGAAEYSSSILRKKCRCKKLEKAAGVEYLAEMRMGMEATQETTHKEKKKLSIGNLKSVKRGEGEAVLGYSLRPIFTVVCNEHRNVKKVLQQAVNFYLDRSCGPFLIFCEHRNTMVYWQVDCSGDRKTLTGTQDESDATIFYILKQHRARELSILHCGESLKSASATQVCRISHFLSANSKVSRHEGPVLMEGRAAKLTLRHDAKGKNEEVSIQNWEEDAYYIKLAPRKVQKKTYLALKFTDGTIESKCVESRDEGGRDLAMRFMLKRVESDIGVIMKSRLCSDSAGISAQTDPDSETKGTDNPTTCSQEDDAQLASLLDIQTSPEQELDDVAEEDELLEKEDWLSLLKKGDLFEDFSDSDADLDYYDSDPDS